MASINKYVTDLVKCETSLLTQLSEKLLSH